MCRFPVFTHPLPSPVISLFTRRLTGPFISGPSSVISKDVSGLPASQHSLIRLLLGLSSFSSHFPGFCFRFPPCVCVCVYERERERERESTCVFSLLYQCHFPAHAPHPICRQSPAGRVGPYVRSSPPLLPLLHPAWNFLPSGCCSLTQPEPWSHGYVSK